MSNRNYGLGPAAGEYSAEDDNQLQPQTGSESARIEGL